MITGKGVFIWQGKQCGPKRTGFNDVQSAVDVCVLMGLTHVVLKIGDGTSRYSQSYADMAAAVQSFRAAGIGVWLWHYVTCGVWFNEDDQPRLSNVTPEMDAAFALKAIRELKPDGYVIDAEKELKVINQKERARNFMKTLMAGSGPGIPVALSSFRFPRLHPELPWDEFLAGCDLVMPEVYWQPKSIWHPKWGPEGELRESITQTLAKRQLPIVPTGRAYIGDGHPNPTTQEITTFLETAKSLGCPAANFWALDFLFYHLGGQARMEAISDYAWDPTTPIPTPQDPPVWPRRAVITAFSLRVRKAPGMDAATIRWLWKGNTVDVLQVMDLGELGRWAEVRPGEWAATTWRGRIYMEFTNGA